MARIRSPLAWTTRNPLAPGLTPTQRSIRSPTAIRPLAWPTATAMDRSTWTKAASRLRRTRDQLGSAGVSGTRGAIGAEADLRLLGSAPRRAGSAWFVRAGRARPEPGAGRRD